MMMRLLRALVFTIALTVPASVGAGELKPHMAMYGASLKGAPAGVTAEGQIIISLIQRCKIWDVRQSMNLIVGANGRTALVMVMGQEGEESIDGKSMTAKTQLAVNGKDMRSTDKATTAGLGKAGKVDVEQGGARSTVELPDGSYFFAGAANRMVNELGDGKKAFTLKVYDSAITHAISEQKYELVPSPFSNAALPADPGGLLKGKSWVVKYSTTINGQPSETFVQVHESGVSSRIMQNIGGIQIEFTLQSLQGFPVIGC
jgi:hypothetical protein